MMTLVVYHIRNGTASTTSCSPPKYRRKAIYGKLRADIGKYLRRLCEYKGVEIVEAHARQNTTKDRRKFIHGISQRKEQLDHL